MTLVVNLKQHLVIPPTHSKSVHKFIMIFVVSQGCMAGVDTVQGIWWPDTVRNTIAQQKCPGGANSVGQSHAPQNVHTR